MHKRYIINCFWWDVRDNFFFKFSIGEYIRFLFFSFSVIASSELRGNFQISSVWLGLLAIILGIVVVSVVFCSLNRGQDKIATIVTDLYHELYLLAKGEKSDYVNARIRAWLVLDLSPKVYFKSRLWMLELVEHSDVIAANLSFSRSDADIQALKYIISVLSDDSQMNAEVPHLELVNVEVLRAIDIISLRNKEESLGLRDLVYNAKLNKEIKKIFTTPKNSQKTFIWRLVLTGLVCYLFSIVLPFIINFPLNNHGFWVPLSGCLMVMPGYYGTFGKVSSRSIGSLIGCSCGALFFFSLPESKLFHLITYIIIGSIFVILYVFIRNLSQAILMLSVTLWLSFILGGYNASFTRIIDVVLAAAITIIIILIIPTYHDEDFNKNIGAFVNIFIANNFLESYSTDLYTILNDLYSAQERLNVSIKELQFDTSLYNLDWSLSELSEVQKITETIIYGIIQVYYYIDSEGLERLEVINELAIYQKKLCNLISSKSIDFTMPSCILTNNSYLPTLKKGVSKLEQIFKK